MTYQPITRGAVERAEPLTFEQKPPAEKQANIAITVSASGLSITAEYTGTLGSIPAAIERLKAAGVLELVRAPEPVPISQPRAKKERVAPAYDGNGDPICPVHRKPLAEGRYGMYCPAKAKAGEEQNDKGYCAIRFSE